MRDSQRSAVYSWERKVRDLVQEDGPEYLSLDECTALVEKVWADYKPERTRPAVINGSGRATGGRWTIKLPHWARTKIVVLHETAHSLQIEEPWHGPYFARLVLELWARYAGVPKAQAKHLGVIQRPRRVRFAPPKKVPHAVSREWKAWYSEIATLRASVRQLQAAEPPKYRNGAQ